jgi:hypothetical protein
MCARALNTHARQAPHRPPCTLAAAADLAARDVELHVHDGQTVTRDLVAVRELELREDAVWTASAIFAAASSDPSYQANSFHERELISAAVRLAQDLAAAPLMNVPIHKDLRGTWAQLTALHVFVKPTAPAGSAGAAGGSGSAVRVNAFSAGVDPSAQLLASRCM